MKAKKLHYIGYVGAGLLALFFLGVIYFFLLIKDIPDAHTLTTRQVFESTKIFDRTGEVLLYEIHGEEKRTIIPFEEIPESIKQATLATEDEGFYEHPAFDWQSIIRAFIINISKVRFAQGGSTITQQLAKNAFLSPEKTITRKIKELVLAFKLEKQFTKDEIFNLYLNQIPYGSNAYGIEAAAETFFDKSAKELNIAESALLASLPKAPSYYSPYGSHTDQLMARKDAAIEKMFNLEFITEEEKDTALNYEFDFAPDFTSIKAPHFSIMVQDYLNTKYGEDFVRTSGLDVITTLDWDLQQLAEQVVADGAQRNEELYGGKNAALVAQEANTGQILALVGSRNYFEEEIDGNFNVAVQGLRQPGSAIKPLAYIAAFKKGLNPDTIVFDVETEFDTTEEEENSYKPHNFDEIFRGPVTLREGLSQSINIPSIKALYIAGIDNMLKLARDFGITTLTERSRYGLSLVLGGGEVKLIDLVNAYSVFAQEGIRHKQSFILSISDENKILEEYSDNPVQVIEPQYTRLINDILSDVESRSGLFSSSLPLTVFANQEVALKTGTTNDYRDAWTIGYTPSLVVGVWAGNSDNTPLQEQGGSILAAIPMWSEFMRGILSNRPTETFNRPDPIFVEKPMMKGEYLINYWVDGEKYPQLHNLLYYINKRDPLGPALLNPENDSQFDNWEEPTLAWALENIQGFEQEYNQPVPTNAEIRDENSSLTLKINSPRVGDFINGPITVSADVKSSLNIKGFEVYFNNNLIDRLVNPPLINNQYFYRKSLTLNNAGLQNVLRIIIVDDLNNKVTKEVILYQ